MSEKNEYDIIIIGGGPAGFTAAIYSSRELNDTLLLEKELAGGLPTTTHLIENYPGFPEGVAGVELMEKIKEQALRFGTELEEMKGATEIEKLDEGRFRVKTSSEEYIARSVIVASGSVPKPLGIPGEKELRGKGVSYCGTCDGPFFKGRDVAVIGCGNSGLQEGEFLLTFVKSLTFVEYLPYVPGSQIIQKRLHETGKVRFLVNHAITSINGEEGVDSITVKSRSSAKEKNIEVSGVFVYVGFAPNTDFLGGVLKLDEKGYIETDENMATSVPGIFAAGDVRSKKIRQITGAASDGTLAAIEAGEYIKSLESAG